MNTIISHFLSRSWAKLPGHGDQVCAVPCGGPQGQEATGNGGFNPILLVGKMCRKKCSCEATRLWWSGCVSQGTLLPDRPVFSKTSGCSPRACYFGAGVEKLALQDKSGHDQGM